MDINTNFDRADATRRVLLVGAEGEFRTRGTVALRAAGYSAHGEASADKAWSTLCTKGYDLIIIDHKLSETSGLRFVLRMAHAKLTIPVILITETSPLLDPAGHQHLRAISVVLRPVNAERLVAIVFLALAREETARPSRWKQPSESPIKLLRCGAPQFYIQSELALGASYAKPGKKRERATASTMTINEVESESLLW